MELYMYRLIQALPVCERKLLSHKLLDHGCFATQHLVGDKNQFAVKITKPLPAEITKPNHVVASMGTGFHESVKQCKSLRCWEVKLSPREVPRILSQRP